MTTYFFSIFLSPLVKKLVLQYSLHIGPMSAPPPRNNIGLRILKKLSEKLKNGIRILVDQAVLELLINIVLMNTNVTQEPVETYLKRSPDEQVCYGASPWSIFAKNCT